MGNRDRRPASLSETNLNQMQLYLGEETIEDYQNGWISRRAMLKRLIVICGGSMAAAALMSACGVSPTQPSASEPTSAVANTVPAAASSTPAVTSTTPIPSASATTSANTPLPPATSAGSHSPLAVAADDPAVKASDVTFKSDTDVLGYLAQPAKDGTYPGVIVIHENRGLTDHIKDVARRLAKAGYLALAPDLVSRNGGTAKTDPDKIAGFLSQAKPEDLVKDLNAGIDFLIKQPGIKSNKVGVVGFCFGGAYVLRLAAANPNVAAAVPYYGVTPQPASQMAQTNAAILGQYGALDQRVDATIPDLEKTLKDAGKIFEKHLYDGAGHAFNNDTGASYNEAAAVAAWKATLDWFAKYL